jgi:hypothetical protein
MTAAPIISGSALALLGGVGADMALHVPGWELACVGGLAGACTAVVVALWPRKRVRRALPAPRPTVIVEAPRRIATRPALPALPAPVPYDMAAIVLERSR